MTADQPRPGVSTDTLTDTELLGLLTDAWIAPSPEANALLERIGDLEIRVLDGHATPAEITEYQRLATLLETCCPMCGRTDVSRRENGSLKMHVQPRRHNPADRPWATIWCETGFPFWAPGARTSMTREATP